jgi:Ser/Thr protein kinase RdoA (MazF antagonist)
VNALLEQLVGAPLALEQLKHKPGRRRTLRARGPKGTAIVKLYVSDRAATVAARIAALAAGPPEPALPRVLASDPDLHMVVLSEVHGRPLTRALLAGDAAACRRAGEALGRWHCAWRGRAPKPLHRHGIERELAILERRAEALSPGLAADLRSAAGELAEQWECPTVVHRDLYEEQILLGDKVGLIDLDDTALGPPELDAGNLLAHVELLSLRSGRDLGVMCEEFLAAYVRAGVPLDWGLVDRCRRLARLRLACIHDEPEFIPLPRQPSRRGAGQPIVRSS